MSPRDPIEGVRSTTEAYRYAGVGLQFAATLGVFGWAGHWLDGKLGSEPFGLAGGVLLGFALGTYSMLVRFSPKKSRKKPSSLDDAPDETEPPHTS